MTPQIAPGESFDGPGPGVCAFFKDMGWPMGPDCLGQIVNPANEPLAADGRASLEVTGPNPFAGRTELSPTLRESGDVRMELIDVTGRVVSVLYDGRVAAGARTEVAVEAATLPAGLYVARVVGDGFTTTRRLVLAR